MLPIDRRENVRVRDRLPVAYRLVTAEDIAENIKPERYFPFIWNKYPQAMPPEDVDEQYIRILHQITELHRKMDILIETVSPENRTLVELPKEIDVCISASGLNINLNASLPQGQIIIFCIVLPFIPPANIFAAGEVTRSYNAFDANNEEDSSFGTAVKFISIKEDDRETLIRYLFKRQRDMLRDRALEKGLELESMNNNEY